MPIYNLNNKRYNIPDDVVADFEKDNPEALVSYSSGDKVYDIPVNKKDRFLKKYPDAKPYADNQTESSKPYDHVYDENMNLVGGAAYDDITKGSSKQDPKVQQHILDNKPDMFKPKTVDMYGAHDKDKSEIDLMNEGKLYQMKAMRAASTIGEQLDERIKANDEALKEAYSRRYEKVQSPKFVFGAGANAAPKVNTTEDDESIKNLLAEQDYLGSAKKVFDAAKDDAGFFRGMKDAVNSSWLTFGVSGLHNAERISGVQQKLESGQALTDSEQSLLTSLGLQQMVNEQYNDLLGRWYKAGMITAEMAPFMAEMAVNPMSAFGKSAMKWTVKKFGEKGAKAIAAKVLSRTIGDVAGAAGMAATTGMPGVAAEAMERQRGYVTTDLGEKGTIKGVDFEGGEKASDAWRKAFTARTIENWSEMVGEYFSPVGKAVGKGFTKAFDKMGLSKVNEFIDNINSSDWVKLLDDFSERTQWNGPLGEFAEEQVGMIANAALVGDTKWSDITDLDKQLDVALGVGVFGTAMSLLRIGGYRTPKYRARKAVENADKEGTKLYGEELWETVKFGIDNSSDEEMGKTLSTMIIATLANQEQAEAAFKYANALKAQQAVNTVKEKAKIDMPGDMAVKAEAAYDEGSELQTPYDKHSAKRVADKAEEALAQDAELAKLVIDGGNNPVATVNAMAESGKYTEAQIKLAKDYYTAVYRMNGLTDALLDRVDSQIESANAEVDANTNKDNGSVTKVHLRDGREGYVVEGTVTRGEKGIVDVNNSDDTVMVRLQNGEVKMMNPNKDLFGVFWTDSPENLKEENKVILREKLIDQGIGEIDWNPSTPNPRVGDSFEMGGVPVTIVSHDGKGGMFVVTTEEYQSAVGSEQKMQQLIAKAQQSQPIPASEYKNWASAQLDAQEDAHAMAQQEAVSGESVGEQVNDGVNAPVNTEAQKAVEEKRPMTEDEAAELIFQMERNAVEAPEIELTPENWIAEFGEDGLVETPIGQVKFGQGQYVKLQQMGRRGKLGMIKPTLTEPDVIVEDKRPSKDGSHERDFSYVFIKAFTGKDGKRMYYFTSVTIKKDGSEVVISNQEKSLNKISRLLQGGNVVWTNSLFSSHPTTQIEESVPLNDSNKPTSTDNQSAWLGINSSELSTNKDSDKNVQSQENKQDFVAMGVEKAFKVLGEKYGEKMPKKVEVTAKALANDLKKAENAMYMAQNDLDNAPIGREDKPQAKLDKAKQDYEAVKREADFWAEMDAEVKNAQAKREAMLNPQAEVDTSNEPMTADEFIAQQLAVGNIVLSKEDYMAQTGYGKEEVRAMNGGTQKLLTDNGMTLDEAGERLMEMDRENGTNFFDQADSNAGRDALISLLGSVKSRKELNQYVAENRKAQAAKESEGLRNEVEKQVVAANYSSLEDYVLQMEASEMENPFLNDRADEIMAIFAEEAAKYEQSINNIENGQGTESEASEGSDSVLPEESSDNTGGTETDNESASAGNGTDEEGEGAYDGEQDSEVEDSQKRILDVFGEAARIAAKNRREQIKARVKMWEAAGVKVKVHERTSGIHNMDARRAIMSGEIVAGWYDGEVHIYLPHISSLAELDKTILHEAISHKGLRALMGKENFDKLCDKVWEMMPESAQKRLLAYEGVKNIEDEVKQKRAAADEYMAHLAEDENLSPEEKSLWQKIVQWFKDLFTTKVDEKEQAVSILNQSRLTNKDISELLKLSYANLKRGAAESVVGEGTRFRFSKTPEEFDAIQNKAVEKKGIVMPGLNEVVVDVLGIDKHDFNGNLKQAREEAKQWAFENYQGKEFSLPDEGGLYTIGKKAINKYVDKTSIDKSDNAMIHLSALKELPNIISSSVTGEIHADYKKDENGERNADNGIGDKGLLVHRMYGAIKLDGKTYRVKTTMNEYRDPLAANNPHSYEVTEIELIESSSTPSSKDDSKLVNVSNNSITGTKLLNGVEKSYDKGKKLLDESEKSRFRVVKDKNELVAVHNISEDNLRKVLNVGGLIMPSIAITKADMGHEGYGEISLLFDKETINPSDRRNKVYGGDAWTPRFPHLDIKLNNKVMSNLSKTIRDLLDDREVRELYSISSEIYPDNIERKIANDGVEGYYGKEWMKLAYLLYSGKKVKIPMKMKDYGSMSGVILDMAKEKGLKAYDIMNEGYDFYQNNPDFVNSILEIKNRNVINNLPEGKRDAARKFLKSEISYSYFDSLISQAVRMEYDLEHGGLKKIIDRDTLSKSIEKKVKTNNADYNKWVDGLFNGIIEKYGIRNNKDMFTPSGSQRPWEQLHDTATPANILKYMLAENEQGGSGGFFDSNIMGASADTYESIEEIREKGKKRLRKLEEGEYDEWSNSVSERMSDICNDFLSAKQRNEFGASIDAKIDITNAVAKDKTANGIYKTMKRDYPGFTMEHAKKVEEIVKEIQNFAIGYFEAKPRRIVPLIEVRKAIVPKKTSDDILEGLKNNGIEVAMYKNGDEAARARLIKKESNGIRFRIVDNEKQKLIDKEYVDAVREGDFGKAVGLFREYVLDKAEENGVVPIDYAVGYRGHSHSSIAKKVKEENPDAISEAAYQMSKRVPKGSILVPMPSRSGKATYTIKLAEAIAKATESEVRDVLKGEERMSVYEAKKKGLQIDSRDLGLYVTEKLPKDKNVVIIDNVIDRGITALAAVEAVDGGSVLAYAFTKGSKDRVVPLKLSDPITYDDNLRIIPLSERFNANTDDLRFRVVKDPAVDYISQAEDVVEVQREEVMYTMNNIASQLYRTSGRFMRQLYKYGTLGRVLKGEYAEIDQIKAKQEYDHAKPILEDYLNELVWMKYQATEAAQEVINDVISDVEYAMQYYKDLSLGKDVWRTKVSPRFRISTYGKIVKEEVDRVTSKYNSKDVMFFDKEMTDEEVSAVVPGYTAADIKPYFDNGILGGYSSSMDKISIFANNNPVYDVEDTIFHENLHALLAKKRGIINAFAENALSRFPKNVKKLKEAGYPDEEIPEELLVRLATKAMAYGIFDDVAYNLPEREFEELKELLNEFGYGYEQEIRSRALAEGRRGTPTLLGGEEIHETRGIRQDAEGVEGKKVEGRARKERLGKLLDQVADMGLEGVLGNKEYSSMMVDIFKAFPEKVRTEISDDAIRLYGGSIAPAVSDYIGPKSKDSLMDKVVTIVREALRKIGIDIDLNANEVRYMAWRSKKPLDRRHVLEVAEDMDMRHRLKVREYAGSPSPDGGVLEQIKKARAEVEKNPTEAQKEAGNYKKGHITLDGYDITLENPKGGTRSGTDKNGKKWSITMNNDYGYIRGTEAVDGDHINIFLSDNPTEGNVFVVDQSNEDGTFDECKVMYGFNSLEEARQAYLSNYENGWESRIMAITEVPKDEFKKWIYSSHKKTKPFSEYKNVKSYSENARFRVTNKLKVRDEYEATVRKGGYQAREAVQDAMLSLRRFQELIEKASGKAVRGFENAWWHENRMSSMVQAAIHEMERKVYKPMMDVVKKLMNAAKLSEHEVADYLMLKHGIERNREMAIRKALTDSDGKIDRTSLEQWYQDKRNVRSRTATPHLDTWRKQQEELDNIALMYGADMSRDYSGLTSMFGTDDLADSTQKAYDEVEALETAHPAETEALGKAVKAMTQNTLDYAYESGLMDKKVYDELSHEMYDYYIPLRGFDETTSDEVYAYLDQDRSAFNAPLKRAKGRSSKADNPLAYIKSIAESGIMQGNRNKMKQSFLALVMNRPSDLISVKEGVWAVLNPATGEWEAASVPPIPDNATPADVEAIMTTWDEQMELRAQSDPDNVRKITEADDVPYRVIGNRMNQHQVLVRWNGKSYTLTVNGNPRLAMALNGLTNPNNTSNDGKVAADVQKAVNNINRQLASWYTTRNPDFVASNFMRDTFYTNTIVRAKEGNRYANQFHKHYAKLLMPGRMLKLFRKWENGTLDTSNPMERDFYEFMINGGETGYSNLKDMEEIKKQISKELKGGRWKDVEKFIEKFDLVNRAVENTARFAAYRTSKQMGRATDRAIFDAKEISVNFNKKGAGGTFYKGVGQTRLGNMASMVGAGGRALYVFFNAAIQGTTNIMHVMKKNKKGTGAGLAAMFLMGAVVPMLFGDDDEKDYYDLPEHVRRNHLILPGFGDSWISIPLPIEYRIMYGAGELLTSWRTGHEKGENIGMKMMNLTGQSLPLNFLEEGMDAFIPSALSPLWQVYNNKSWTGLPIYKDNEFNKDDPEYTKAYKNVNRVVYNFTKALYDWTFDEENQKEGINLNPAVIEHLAKGYFGGLVTTLDNVWKTGEMIAGSRDFDWRNVPVANRTVKTGDERTKEKKVQNEYFENLERLDFLQSRKRLINKTMNGAAVPEEDKAEARKDFDALINSNSYKEYMKFNEKKKQIDKLRKAMKEQGASDELNKRLNAMMESANNVISE